MSEMLGAGRALYVCRTLVYTYDDHKVAEADMDRRWTLKEPLQFAGDPSAGAIRVAPGLVRHIGGTTYARTIDYWYRSWDAWRIDTSRWTHSKYVRGTMSMTSSASTPMEVKDPRRD